MEFPKFRQTYNYDCGAKAIESVLAYYGIDVKEEEIIKIAGTKKTDGTSLRGIEKVARRFGLRYKEGKMSIDKLKKNVDKKVPVIICIQAWNYNDNINWEKDWKDGHYAVVVGYSKKRIYFEDPASIFRTYLSFNDLERRWHDIDSKRKKKLFHWGIAFFRKKNSKNQSKEEIIDYKKPGKRFSYNPNKAIYMGYKRLR